MTHHTVAGGWSPFPEETDQFTGESLLERIARSYEKAVDAAGDSFDEEALAENNYLKLHAIAYAEAVENHVAATKRGEWCDNQLDVCDARQELNRAIAKRKRCALKAIEMEHRLVSCQSYNRMVREATGG